MRPLFTIMVGTVLAVGLVGQLGCASRSVNSKALSGFDTDQVRKDQEVYKQVGKTELALNIFTPVTDQMLKDRPAIVFFFGGGWSTGSPDQFEEQARYFASRGIVAFTADYRVRTRHQSKVVDSVADARSAIRWVRSHSERLGVDPSRIAAAGGSAGGHLAASAAFIEEFDDPREDKSISAVPNALVLFNPALVLAPMSGISASELRAVPKVEILGAEASRISPAHHVSKNGPATIIFHGELDKTVPPKTVLVFEKQMKEKKNKCEVVIFPGQDHGFFNRENYRSQTISLADEFLVSLGWLPKL